jgi:mono/diheme cytochrome c family protein
MQLHAILKTIPLALLCAALTAACGRGEAPVYAVGPDTIYQGSIYYATGGCAGCHGVGFDGQGPDARELADKGVVTPGFKDVAIDPGKTPTAYFKAITVGSERVPGHNYQAYTDRGRWAMAHFLYSLTKKPAGEAAQTHALAVAAGEAEAADAYAKSRRWEMGYKPIGERPRSPALNTMLASTALEAEISAGAVDDARRARAEALAEAPGADLYNNNCARCHGVYGEGSARAVRIGPVPCKDEPTRNCPVFLGVRDFRDSGALGSVGAFSEGHTNASGLNLPAYSSLSDDEWQSLYEYVQGLSGR